MIRFNTDAIYYDSPNTPLVVLQLLLLDLTIHLVKKRM